MNDRIKAFLDDALARAPVEVVSKLDRAEVLRRLQAGVDSEWTFGGAKGFVGRVGDDGFRLRARIGYRNSFQTFMFGTVQSEGRGTKIVARTGMHPFAAIFMTLWLSVVAIGVAIGVAGLIEARPEEPMLALFALVPVGMLAFGVALVGIGRWIARNERARLIAFLESTADGRARQHA
jgi:hypothetical protein